MIEKLQLKFDILHDHGNSFAEQLDLVHSFPDDLKEVYLKFGADLAEVNGESSWTLPIPTRLIVDQSHKVVSIQYDADYKIRPEPEEVLQTF